MEITEAISIEPKQPTLDLEGKTIIALPPNDFKSRLKKMVPFMSTEETRAYICGIQLVYSNNNLKLTATNGHILCEMKFSAEASEENGSYSVIIPSSAIKHLIKVMPTDRQSPVILIKHIPSTSEVEFQAADFSYITKIIDMPFPDTSSVIPDGKVKMREGFPAGYLVDALKALGNSPVDISVDDEEISSSVAHLLTSEEVQGVRVVLMPMRV